MKHEWRKHEKLFYGAKTTPECVDIPSFKFFTISGTGRPDAPEFAEKVEALYALSYAIRMMPKTGVVPEGYFEYTVYPLEGIWDLTERGRKFETLKKEELVYTLMIRQPFFVTETLFQSAQEKTFQKKKNPAIKKIAFETIAEGLCVQALHKGPFESERETFEKMRAFVDAEQLCIRTLAHREIYLSDFRKTAPENLKTVLRWRVAPLSSV
ncbi:GyrI-like domain-containing protein [Fusibacter sp. JL298sf-3]